MSSLRTLPKWTAIIIPLIVVGFLVFTVIFAAGIPATQPPDPPGSNGGFFQSPISPQQQFTKSVGDWRFIFTSSYTYTLAGKVVGRREYPGTMPEGIVPLDLAVVNGELIRPDILPYFTFEMGYHTLKYSYDIPTFTGLTEEYIDEHISNNHLIFVNSTLENEVKKAREGGCMIITGKLVDIRGTSPEKLYIINTSTVRTDGYPTGCEIILVESYTQVSC